MERQTLTGFPAAHGALFTIRPQLYPPRAAALRPMTPGQQIYKGLQGAMPALLIWLDRRAL
ncbi:hypothetical protein ORD21_09495 [Deinococcus sp. ZS9-10]|uniref:Uncharacterized protein n=1 Tax=Deinococcus arenicola TaxID=2994950 RepID=A0ABU4DRV2_9DEIO|nr:hypothetical protein [Deinococcus sp. ZS9-10]MDV6374819.1 hypothetical protein [Deinococcus sp. ZS9-10]